MGCQDDVYDANDNDVCGFCGKKSCYCCPECDFRPPAEDKAGDRKEALALDWCKEHSATITWSAPGVTVTVEKEDLGKAANIKLTLTGQGGTLALVVDALRARLGLGSAEPTRPYHRGQG